MELSRDCAHSQRALTVLALQSVLLGGLGQIIHSEEQISAYHIDTTSMLYKNLEDTGFQNNISLSNVMSE